ncbi:MAG TPA: [NiFe]-hydrogenase assembly chaperone HybE [Albitalea sp.]|nr:[NiFe]-hydrogenase assembly chaperone HybE [Albitalea sp.]
MRLHRTDPSAALEAAFRRIERERMTGLPLLNPALRVQAVGFERWQGHWLGALVTPWFINLVLLPGVAEGWQRSAVGERSFHRFGAGDFAFLGNEEPELGEFQSCSLCSPVSDFPDHETALTTARMALRMLHVEQPAAALVGSADATACGHAAPAKTAAAPSRRVILFGGRAN